MNKRTDSLRGAIKVSITEGIFAQIHATMSSIGTVFITKFAIMLNATPMQFGILSSIGQLSQLFQPLASVITKDLDSRKSPTVNYALAGRFMTLLIPVIPFIFEGTSAMIVFLTVCFFSTVLQAISGNMWIAWISDLVPLRFRGRFFSNRAVYLTIAAILTGYVFGFFLDMFDSAEGSLAGKFKGLLDVNGFFNSGNLKYAYITIFGTASAIGIYGLQLLKKQHERPKRIETESSSTIILSPFRDRNFRRLLVFGCWWMLAVGVGAPFWQPYMITGFKMSMIELQVYGTFATFGSLLMLRPWGRFIDRFGNKPAMIIAIILGTLNPAVWLFATGDRYWFLFVEAFASGIMWSGTGVIITNLVLAVAPEGKQQIYSGVYSAVAGLAMVVTMLMSGTFLPEPMNIAGLHLDPEQVLFGLTGILRFTAIIPLIGVYERKAKPIMLIISHLNDFTKVRIMKFTGRMFK